MLFRHFVGSVYPCVPTFHPITVQEDIDHGTGETIFFHRSRLFPGIYSECLWLDEFYQWERRANHQQSDCNTAPGTPIKTASVVVNGKSETILTDARGKTLYYFTPDTATSSACTGSCAQNWPPLLATGSSAPTSPTTLPGKLTTLSAPVGKQVLYNGHLLYTFAGDSAPGQLNGEGKLGKWFVATPNLTKNT